MTPQNRRGDRAGRNTSAARSIMGGAAEVPTGKGQKTFKAQSQSSLLCRDFHWPLLVGQAHPRGGCSGCMQRAQDI